MDKYNVGGQQLNVEKSKSSGRGGGGGGGHSNSGGARGRLENKMLYYQLVSNTTHPKLLYSFHAMNSNLEQLLYLR